MQDWGRTPVELRDILRQGAMFMMETRLSHMYRPRALVLADQVLVHRLRTLWNTPGVPRGPFRVLNATVSVTTSSVSVTVDESNLSLALIVIRTSRLNFFSSMFI